MWVEVLYAYWNDGRSSVTTHVTHGGGKVSNATKRGMGTGIKRVGAKNWEKGIKFLRSSSAI
jgi:hypothetical protein